MMATRSLLSELLARIPEDADLPLRRSASDLDRLAMETHLERAGESARILASTGELRLHGQPNEEHYAPLALVGSVATAWQRAVTAMGASLEGFTQTRGRLPGTLLHRTTLVLQAAPGAGSLVLEMRPSADPIPEAEPGGNRAMFDGDRPLADRASEALVTLCQDLAAMDLNSTDKAAAEIRERGPRLAGAIRSLASAVSSGTLDLDASWAEPGRATVACSWNTEDARQIVTFIEGRNLEAEVYELEGVAVTVSNRERWLVEEDDGSTVHVQVGDLTDEEVRSVRSMDRVRLQVEAVPKVSPAGEARTSRRALRLLGVIEMFEE